MGGLINRYVSRQIVPFYFEYEKEGYERIYEELSHYSAADRSLGVPKNFELVEKPFWGEKTEMDLYPYLKSLYCCSSDSDKLKKSTVGTSFGLVEPLTILKLLFQDQSFEISDLGVIIYKNGIGFFWYEIRTNSEIVKNADNYIAFQNIVKELSKTNRDKISKKTGKESSELFYIGKWIYDFLKFDTVEVSYWAERNHDGLIVPDKSLLFQYVLTDSKLREERFDFAFHLANGYGQSYELPFNIEEHIYEPFGNASFYLSHSGCAYVVSDNGLGFFDGNFITKFTADYFFIYTLLLYQSLSANHYSRLLTKLPADIKDLDETTIIRLEELDTQIDLFLVKSIFESVSTIPHQNAIYQYGKKVLCIENDINALTIGLSALRNIEQEKMEKVERELLERKDRSFNWGVGVLSILAIVSVIMDTISLVDRIAISEVGWVNWHFIAVFIIILIMIIVLIKSRTKK